MSSISIAIAVEAGDWPAEAALRELAKRAIEAAVAAIDEEASSHPSPSRFAAFPSQPLRQAQGEGGGKPRRGRRLSPYLNPPPQGEREGAELSIVFTNDAAMRKLNKAWRGKDQPTNVLSFPQASGPLLGDVTLSAETVRKEAALAEMPLEDHMAHLIIHGFLHLLGYDHEVDVDAEKMERLERVALMTMGIPDPTRPPLDNE